MSDSTVETSVADVYETMARTPSASHSLVDYEDISGEVPPSRTTSIATQVAQEDIQEPLRALSTMAEVETDSEDSEAPEEVKEAQEAEKLDEFAGAVGMASIVLVGGILLGALGLYLNKPVFIEHPFTRGDYF